MATDGPAAKPLERLPRHVTNGAQPGARTPREVAASAIDGVRALDLDPYRDERGELIELCRHVWVEPRVPVQWNLVVNKPGVLRGIHWHERHTDYLR